MELHIATTDIPTDEAPVAIDAFTGDYDPAYPGSTPEAPYGYKDDGTPYRRRPRGTAGTSRGSTASKNMPAPDRSARTAAGLLARANGLVGIGLMAFGMPLTAASMAEANTQFEEMAYQALLADPGLCKKILSTGATSGKAGLVIAYSMLAVNLFPAARQEISERRAQREEEYEDVA